MPTPLIVVGVVAAMAVFLGLLISLRGATADNDNNDARVVRNAPAPMPGGRFARPERRPDPQPVVRQPDPNVRNAEPARPRPSEKLREAIAGLFKPDRQMPENDDPPEWVSIVDPLPEELQTDWTPSRSNPTVPDKMYGYRGGKPAPGYGNSGEIHYEADTCDANRGTPTKKRRPNSAGVFASGVRSMSYGRAGLDLPSFESAYTP